MTNRKSYIKMSVAVCMMLVLALAFSLSGCSNMPEHPLITAKNGEIILPLNEIADGKVHFYTYKNSGNHVNFFVRTDGSGNLSAHFDACFTCYKNRKGYRVEGDNLVCNECSMQFAVADETWDNTDGCSPIRIRSERKEDHLVLKTADIEKGARLFRK